MSATEKTKPPLLALLICDQVMLDEGKAASLIRVVDTINFSVDLDEGDERQLEDIKDVGFLIQVVVFTRWGLGGGEFTTELGIVGPDGTELSRGQGTKFTKPPGFHFMQIRHEVKYTVAKPGIYAFRVYLDGELKGEHPFRVNVEIRKKPPN